MNILIIINESPLANEKAYNALRTGMQFQKDGHILKIYLIADGVYCAMNNTKVGAGTSNIENMVKEIVSKGGEVKMCTSCGNSRGLSELKIIEGAEWTNLKTLTDWVVQCDRVLNY
jgi:uncharacterized protein involved in oxidation of intracellular sulfur